MKSSSHGSFWGMLKELLFPQEIPELDVNWQSSIPILFQPEDRVEALRPLRNVPEGERGTVRRISRGGPSSGVAVTIEWDHGLTLVHVYYHESFAEELVRKIDG